MTSSACDLKLVLVASSLLFISPATALLHLKTPIQTRLTSKSTTADKRTILSSTLQDNCELLNHEILGQQLTFDRRRFLLGSAASVFGSCFDGPPQEAQARGLVKFPVNDPNVLLNSYHFLRVGDTLLEDEDIWSTNPLFLYVLVLRFGQSRSCLNAFFVHSSISCIPIMSIPGQIEKQP